MVDLNTRPVADTVTAQTSAPAAAPRRSTRHRVATRAGSTLLTVVMVALVALAAITTIVPRLLDAVPLTVLSGSMEPVLSPGDLVVTQPVDANEIAIGDVVTFQPVSDDPTLVTHRIVSVQHGSDGTTGFITRGDANGTDDDPIVTDQVVGRVIYSVPLVGHLTGASWSPTAVAVGVAGLLVYALVMLVVAGRNPRKGNSP